MAKKSEKKEAMDPQAQAEAAKARLEQLKAEMAAARAELKEAKAAAKARTTRIEATVQALYATKGATITIDDLAKAANDVYVQAGGADNIKRATEEAKTVLKVLVAIDRAAVDGKNVTVPELL